MGNTLFGKSKLSVLNEISYLEWFEYTEFDGEVQIFSFEQQMHFLGTFVTHIQNYLFEMKLGAKTNSNLKSLMTMFIYFMF